MANKKTSVHYYIMLLPGLIWLVLFSIVPMFGIAMAFQNFNPARGVFGSEFVGLEHFRFMFLIRDVRRALSNTVIISVSKIVFHLFVPLVFALMLNELKGAFFRRSVQTITYLPHFISWVILSVMILDLFSNTGPVNQILNALGGDSVLFFARPDLFRSFVVASDVWKEMGFRAIIFLAALTGINPELHEAAAMDGAGRLKRLWHITLPGIKTTAVLLATLSLSNVLNAGFDQVFNLYNPVVYATGDIIDTWVYRAGLLNLQFSLATAVGLLRSVVGFFLIAISYLLASKFAGYRIF